MGLIANEIVQSRIWIDPNPTPPPSSNYKNTFPITVFDAVRREMDNSDSETLTQVIDYIYAELQKKQKIIPEKTPDYLMTYGGAAGAVGSIKMTRKISWDPDDWSDYKIPTEKAVGNLLEKYGLINLDGDVASGARILWKDIVGRPTLYEELGDDEEGVITQKAITVIINNMQDQIDTLKNETTETENTIRIDLKNHVEDTNNPHKVTPEQIGAAEAKVVNDHINDFNNPHQVTAKQLGLENVDNTSDVDKPISTATQEALDTLNKMLKEITSNVGLMNYITSLEYNQTTGRLDAIYTDGSRLGVSIVTDGLVDELIFDEKTHILKVYELNGTIKSVDLSSLFNKYIGVEGSHIIVNVNNDGTIDAEIIPKSITADEIADLSLTTSVFADQSVTDAKIKDNTITTIKYANRSVTSEKIARKNVLTENLGDRAVTGEKLFTSGVDNRILAVRTANTNPVWTQVYSDMIAKGVVLERHLAENSVTSEKIAAEAITEEKYATASVSTRALKDESVTHEKLADEAVEGNNIVPNVILPGTPELETRPDLSANNHQLVDTGWIRSYMSIYTINSENIAPRSVLGSHLFTTGMKNRILGVLTPNGDPEWTRVNHEMLREDAVETENILDLAVTADKIANNALESRHFNHDVIETVHVQDSAITSEKLFTSEYGNRVLAAISDNGHPLYSKVVTEMMANDSVTADQLADQSIQPSHFARPDLANSILAFTVKGQDPVWTQIITQLIADGAVTSKKIYPSVDPNMVLAVRDAGTSAYYMKLNGEMMESNIIESRHLTEKAVQAGHIADQAIKARHMDDNAVENHALADEAVDGRTMIKTNETYKVWAIGSKPYADAEWTQVVTQMIAPLAVTPDKLFSSTENFRLLGVRTAGDTPEYVNVTGDFIADGTIGPSKLLHNMIFYGHPTVSDHPYDDSDDYTIADTWWVRQKVEEALQKYIPDINALKLDIPDHSIDGQKLMTSEDAPAVLGIDSPNGDVKFFKIFTELLENGSVTRDKLERSIQLLGSPSIEVRPAPQSSDETDMGDLIPDCQWVLDRVNEGTKALYDELAEKICCLQEIDPMRIRTDHIIVSSIDPEKVALISDAVEDDYDLHVYGSEALIIDGERFEPIPSYRLEDLIRGNIEPDQSDPITIGDTIVDVVPSYRIDGLIDGTIEAKANPEEPFEIDLDTVEEGCCSCRDDVDRSYIVPITSKIVDEIISGDAEPEATLNAEAYENYIEPIPYDTIQQIADGTLTIDRLYIDTDTLNIDEDGHLSVESTEDSIGITFDIDENDHLIVTYDGEKPYFYLDPDTGHLIMKYTAPNTVEINDEVLEPVPLARIRGIITGEIDPEVSIPLDITEYEPEKEDEKELGPGCIVTEYLQDRCVTGEKLFTSIVDNAVLAVLDANSDPQWVKIQTDMIDDRVVDGSKLFSSDTDSRILAVMNANEDPIWTQVQPDMIADSAVETRHILDNAVITRKIADWAITASKLALEPMINTIHLVDRAVTNRKIHDGAITNEKIEDHTIEGVKIARETEIPAYTSTEAHRDYERRALRNTILSPRTPTGGHNGDIWFQYA